MNIVIQCAATKDPSAGYWRTENGRAVSFIAHPVAATNSNKLIYAKPDDISPEQVSWRSLVRKYNKTPDHNPFKLYPAYRLYVNKMYRALVDKFGVERTFILSAGWGLIRADFLTPQYDITFSASAEEQYRRRSKDDYDDFCMLPDDQEPVVFFGGKDYLSLFSSLTKGIGGSRIVYYNSASPPSLKGCTLRRYRTATRTNWHYECVKAFIKGDTA
jgi:hypothetical protein